MTNDEVLDTLLPALDVFEELKIPNYICGSIAGLAFGLKRLPGDIDLVLALKVGQIPTLVNKLLLQNYYIDEIAVRNALSRQSSFNLISYDTSEKVCVYLQKATPFDQICFQRIIPIRLASIGRIINIESPEDLILHKLGWYEQGGGVSDKQWNDIQQVLQHQASKLDQVYLAQWAASLNLTGLLARALQAAGENVNTPSI